eukprot:TRINITY_DN963_c6_g1_i1.p1 TRINITY_DN963_c6_g1~~TRINITY_DN963_c6_g1_i1.p1  ORF type:complete len:115 (+),score=12.18 TRINITY_DN963_c6_g1_i1:53-397(+)
MGKSKKLKPVTITKRRHRDSRRKSSKRPVCGICHDPVIIRGMITTKKRGTKGEGSGCGHLYCFECIGKWATVSNSCPLCRREFNRLFKIQVNTSKRIGKGKRIHEQQFCGYFIE